MEQDTPAMHRYLELLRAQTPDDRARTFVALCNGTRRMALEGIGARHPEMSEEERLDVLAGMLYGPTIQEARRAWRLRRDAHGG